MKSATKTDWEIQAFPEKIKTVFFDRNFDDKDMERIRLGVIPVTMDERWFIYYEESQLHFHRSWTGYEIYRVYFNNENGIIKTLVNADTTQYTATGDREEIEMINKLIDNIILRPIEEKRANTFTIVDEQGTSYSDIEKDKGDNEAKNLILEKIGLKRIMVAESGQAYPSNINLNQFETYSPAAYLNNSSLREMDEVYNFSEIVFVHKLSGLRLHYSEYEPNYEEICEFKLLDIFIITTDGHRENVIGIDFAKGHFLTEKGNISFLHVKKDCRGD